MLDRIAWLAGQARERLDAAGPGAAFFEFFDVVAEQALLNKALCDALEASTGMPVKATSDERREFRAAFAELLRRAQAAGAVRTDVEPGDLTALLAGYLAIRRQAPEGRPLAQIVADGLRA